MARNADLSRVNSSRIQPHGLAETKSARLMVLLLGAPVCHKCARPINLPRRLHRFRVCESYSRVSAINSSLEDFIVIAAGESKAPRRPRRLFSATWVSTYETSTHVLRAHRATRRRRDDNTRDQDARLCSLCLAIYSRAKNWLTSQSRHARWPRRCRRRSR